MGVALGTAAGAAALATTQPCVGAALFVVFLALAGALAWGGEPVAVLVAEKPRRTLSVEMVPIPAGSFWMGSPDDENERYDDEGPVHRVSVSAFECMRCSVTRRLFAEVTGKDPGWPEGDADDRPVNNVSWYEAVRFCNLLSERDGLTHCYQVDGKNVSWIRGANGYRLPTEAEWEYACRARNQARWSFGEDEEQLTEYAYFDKNSEIPQPVKCKKPNDWGLHDMYGNVYDWCWDYYSPYSSDSQKDPTGPPKGNRRVLRGGSFADSSKHLRSAFRNWDLPRLRDQFDGFRCVRSRHQP